MQKATLCFVSLLLVTISIKNCKGFLLFNRGLMEKVIRPHMEKSKLEKEMAQLESTQKMRQQLMELGKIERERCKVPHNRKNCHWQTINFIYSLPSLG